MQGGRDFSHLLSPESYVLSPAFSASMTAMLKLPRIRLCFALLAALLAGCQSMQDMLGGAPRPTAHVVGASIRGLSLENIVLLFDVEVQNPYSASLPLIDLGLFAGQRRQEISGRHADAHGLDPGAWQANPAGAGYRAVFIALHRAQRRETRRHRPLYSRFQDRRERAGAGAHRRAFVEKRRISGPRRSPGRVGFARHRQAEPRPVEGVGKTAGEEHQPVSARPDQTRRELRARRTGSRRQQARQSRHACVGPDNHARNPAVVSRRARSASAW